MKQQGVAESNSPTEASSDGSPASAGAIYKIQEAARIAGVSSTTVRVWEQNGLVSSYRGSNGYRYFNEDDIQRLRRIAHLRSVERLNIEGIKRALAESDEEVGRPTPSDDGVTIGPKLRQLRQSAGMTLGQAAEKSDLSPSFLSALERDQTGVSPQSLHRLAHIYGTTVSALFRRKTTDMVQLTSERKRTRVPMQTRDAANAETGGYVEPLIDGKSLLDAEIVVINPGERAGVHSHDGEEILYVLEGELDVRLKTGQQYKLRSGDSLFYPSTIEHEWRNVGTSSVRFLWAATPPTW